MATNKNPFKPDYEDERLKDVEKQEKEELKSNEALQQELLTKTDNTYNGLKANLDAQTEESKKALEEQTNLSIQQMEQQKEQVDKDLASEQSAAYADYQKETNKYGVNAERRAASGLERTGYSETSQTRMYEAYQNRVAVARSSAETAKQNYELGMQQARMQHSVALAEIRVQALQKQLELSIQGLNARNQIILDFADREQTIKQNANTRWQQVLAQINREMELEEEQRQFNEQYGALEEGETVGGALDKLSGSTLSNGAPLVQFFGNEKEEETTEDYEINYDSLKALGFNTADPRSAALIRQALEAGYIVQEITNGKITYKRNTKHPSYRANGKGD